jgi:hypothetical protein
MVYLAMGRFTKSEGCVRPGPLFLGSENQRSKLFLRDLVELLKFYESTGEVLAYRNRRVYFGTAQLLCEAACVGRIFAVQLPLHGIYSSGIGL